MNLTRRILLSILVLSTLAVAQKKDAANYGARINCATCICEEFTLPLRTETDAIAKPFKVGDRILVMSCGHGNNGRAGCKATIKRIIELQPVSHYLFQFDPQIALEDLHRNGTGRAIGMGLESLCSSRPAMSGQCPCDEPEKRCDCAGAGTEFIAGERQLWLLKPSEARAARNRVNQ